MVQSLNSITLEPLFAHVHPHMKYKKKSFCNCSCAGYGFPVKDDELKNSIYKGVLNCSIDKNLFHGFLLK